MGWEALFTLVVVVLLLYALARDIASTDVLLMGPVGALAVVYLLTLIFTEIVTNNAAAALAFPIAHAAATSLGVNFMPFAIVIAMAASARIFHAARISDAPHGPRRRVTPWFFPL